ncbi:uncharacterized protein LOC111912614 [Lactuca sativa]|uniref:uncharacterized protein LOC111912614 n=1 Tax=Lactuca sativa TaxID=4236 RepID=UPI0022AE9215|nr:uncharacterized protein LOC111912614 [Lactuca sativa]
MVGEQGGRDAFITEGFDNWSKRGSFRKHMGNIQSYHHNAQEKCDLLLRKNQSIGEVLHKQTELEKSNYEIRLRATIRSCRFLLKNTLPFRGHDETEKSNNKGLFIEVLSLIREDNKKIFKVTLENAPKNEKLTSPTIQKDIVDCFSKEIIKSICDEIGIVKERFIGIVHVLDTYSLILKATIDTVFSNNNLSMTQMRGQGYDGASNMSGAFNGLKSLILNENNYAHYIHCFAHQLQLVVVAVAKKHDDVDEFFEQLALVVTVICETGKGLNREISLVRAGDTRWGSHFRTIVSLVNLFAEVVAVLKYVKEEGSTLSNRNQAKDMQIQEFGDRFNEGGTELMENMATLSPCDSFSSFDKTKLLKLTEIYKNYFDDSERAQLNGQLDIYYHSLLHDERFFNLNGIADLSRLLVKTGKHLSFPLVYRLLKLALVLPVATATVERCFSAMKFLKTDLRNRIGDNFMNGALVCSVEKEALENVKTENVITRFRKMKDRRGEL